MIKMDEFMSKVLCEENEEEVVEEEDSYIHLELEDYGVSEDDYVDILIEREMGLGFQRDESLVLNEWVKAARLDAINWILRTRATLGFRFQTAYLSVTYLDRFLSIRSIDSQKYWAFRLLSVACLSVAAKMEECDVPALSEFPSQDYTFESKVIQRMELLVLTILEWKMASITPFAFLSYFITKLCSNQTPPTRIWSNTSHLIFTLIKEVNSMDHRPSVIAAAATLVAMDPHLTRKAVELKMSSVSQCRILEIEDMYACHDLIQRLYTEKTKTDKFLHSSGTIDVLESSLLSSAATSKRRRLTFNDHTQSHATDDGS